MDVQAQAWPAIQSGTDVLIAAPTGSGKTLAVFHSCFDSLFFHRRGIESTEGHRIAQRIVSPCNE